MFLASGAAPTDFYGAILPAWIGAGGGVVSVIIGGVALFQSLGAKRNVGSLRSGLNSEGPPATEGSASVTLDAHGEAEVTGPATLTVEGEARLAAVTWGAQTDRPGFVGLVNQSPVRDAEVTSLDVVSAGARVIPQRELPATVPPGVTLYAAIDRRFSSPSITAIRVTWTEGAETKQTVIYA